VSLLKRQAARRDFVAFAGLIASPSAKSHAALGTIANVLTLPANAELWIKFSVSIVPGNFTLIKGSRSIGFPTLVSGVFLNLGWFERASVFDLTGAIPGVATFYIADGVGKKFPIATGTFT
jgi:hypothetical protein